MLLSELFEKYEPVIYHALRAEYAIKALEDNCLYATTHHGNYKGISFTRDFRFAIRWHDVIFTINRSKLTNNTKLVPRAWKHLPDDNKKREREEFAIIRKNVDDYIDARGYLGNGDDKLENLDRYLTGIHCYRTLKDVTGLEPITNHPKFRGFIY